MKQSTAYGMEKIGAPCVVAHCKGENFYFLIDTGSSDNHLVAYAYQFFKETFDGVIFDEEGVSTTTGLGGSFECKKCSFSFFIGRTRFEDTFVLLPNQEVFGRLSEKMDGPIVGILGGKFLKENHIVIDYANGCLYTKRQRRIVDAETDSLNAA